MNELNQSITHARRSNLDTVALDTLPPATRRELWSALQAHEPSTAALLTSPEFTQVKAQFSQVFGAVRVELPVAVVARAMGTK